MSDKEEETVAKKMKLTKQPPAEEQFHCQHWVVRKKRYCKMEVTKGRKFCGQHGVGENDEDGDDPNRIPCPLDPKHTVYKTRMEKHLQVCNARVPDDLPPYIKTGINLGESEEQGDDDDFKLQDLSRDKLDAVIKKVENLFDEHLAGKIQNRFMEHEVLAEELSKVEFGNEKRRHLVQTSSIIGILKSEDFLKPKTSFIEYGAGKAAVTFWLATAIKKLEGVKVLVIDKASHRHKKDNLIKYEDPGLIQRIRADIGDLDLKGLEIKADSIVGISKHLCGAATDLTLRCMVKGNQQNVNSTGFLICVCCHHRCSWGTFVGKDWLVAQGIDRETFNILIKMVSWCVCGTGVGRNKRGIPITVEKEAENEEKKEIGWKCKRLLDFARLQYMISHNYDVKMSFYAEKSITLENVCITGTLKV